MFAFKSLNSFALVNSINTFDLRESLVMISFPKWTEHSDFWGSRLQLKNEISLLLTGTSKTTRFGHHHRVRRRILPRHGLSRDFWSISLVCRDFARFGSDQPSLLNKRRYMYPKGNFENPRYSNYRAEGALSSSGRNPIGEFCSVRILRRRRRDLRVSLATCQKNRVGIWALRFTILYPSRKKYYRSRFLGTRQKSRYGCSSKRLQRTIWKFWSSAQLWTEHSNFRPAYSRNTQHSLRRPLPCTAGSSCVDILWFFLAFCVIQNY